MSHSSYQPETSRVAREQTQGAVRNTLDAIQTFPGMVNGMPNSGVGAGCVALDSIAGGIGANQVPLQFSAAIDVAQRQFGNRATLQFVHEQQAHHVARAGLRDVGQSYPFLNEIQRSFGKHDISGLEGHTGAAARAANRALGSTAYHKGGQVAFGREPTLADAAHEAAHYVQGVGSRQLPGGVGQPGDVYERHADRVAAAVVAGESAEPLLEQSPPGDGSPAAATGDAPMQMTGGSLSQASGQSGRKEEDRSKQTKPIPSGNVLPPLGVSRKYNPVSSKVTAANDLDVDLSIPGNDRKFRTAGDVVGPLPGPVGHCEFFYIINSQNEKIADSMSKSHAVPGLLKVDEEGKFEDGLMMHSLRNDYLMDGEEFAKGGPVNGKYPSKDVRPTEAGWLAGGIPTSIYKHIGKNTLAPGYNIEMVRAQQTLFQGALGIYLFPISNYDEMKALFIRHLNPTVDDRERCPDINTDPAAFWNIDAANERNPVRSCLDLHNVLLRRAKIVGDGGEEVDLGIRHPQSVAEHYRTLDRLSKEYFRFYDREDIAIRVAVLNNYFRCFLDDHVASDTYKDSEGIAHPKPRELPIPRMPYPQVLNEGRGYIPKHNPYASFTDPELLASYLSTTASGLPEHLGDVWESMPDDIRSGTAEAIIRMSHELSKLREQRSCTGNAKEKGLLNRKILPYEQVLEKGGLHNVSGDITSLADKGWSFLERPSIDGFPQFFDSLIDFLSYVSLVQHHVETMRSREPSFYNPFTQLGDYKHGPIEAMIANTDDPEVIAGNLRRIREKYKGVTPQPGRAAFYHHASVTREGQNVNMSHSSVEIQMGDITLHVHFRADSRRIAVEDDKGDRVMEYNERTRKTVPKTERARALVKPEEFGLDPAQFFPTRPGGYYVYAHMEDFDRGPLIDTYKGSEVIGWGPGSDIFKPLVRCEGIELPEAFSALLFAELAMAAAPGVYTMENTVCVPLMFDVLTAGGADMKTMCPDFASGNRSFLSEDRKSPNVKQARQFDVYLAEHTHQVEYPILETLRDKKTKITGRDGKPAPLNQLDRENFPLDTYPDGTRPWDLPPGTPWPWHKGYQKFYEEYMKK